MRLIYRYFLVSTVLMGAFACTNQPKKTETDRSHDSIVVSLPANQGLVSDYEHLLSPGQKDSLQLAVGNFIARSGHALAIATVDSIAPYQDIVEYASALGNYWGIGDARENDGLIIVVNARGGKVGIATGKGLEDIYTSALCKSVISKQMIPAFARQDFYEGLSQAIDELERRDTLSANPKE